MTFIHVLLGPFYTSLLCFHWSPTIHVCICILYVENKWNEMKWNKEHKMHTAGKTVVKKYANIWCEFRLPILTFLQSKIKQWNTEDFNAPTYGYKISNKMEFSPQMCRSMQQHKPSGTASSVSLMSWWWRKWNPICEKLGAVTSEFIVRHTFLQDGFLTKFKGVGIESSQNCWFYSWHNILLANF